jgi:putative MATE family efflux protein
MQEAVKRKLIEDPVRKALIAFTLPLLLSNLFQQLYNTVDTVIVGHFIPQALASVSTSGHLIFLLIGFFNGMSVGAGVVISKFFGEKKYEDMQKAIHTDLAFGLVTGVLFSVAGYFLTPLILRLLNTPDEIFVYSKEYFQTYFTGAFTVVLYNICTGILQAVGDSKRPLYYLIFSSCLNVVLDLLFIAVFRWGVWAAALATVLSQGISMLLCLARLLTIKEVYRVEFKKIRFHEGMLSKIVKMGLPSGLQNSMIAIANLFVQSRVNTFETAAISGVGCYMKLEGFAFLPITCFSMALTTFIGQNLGAKEFERAKQGAKFGITCSLIVAELIGVIIFLFAPTFLSFFSSDPSVIAGGVKQCRMEALFYFLLAFAHCIAGICRGAGRASVPMVIMLSCWCVIRVIYLAIALSIRHSIEFVFIGYPATWLLSDIFFAIYYFRNDWVHAFERREGAQAAVEIDLVEDNCGD